MVHSHCSVLTGLELGQDPENLAVLQDVTVPMAAHALANLASAAIWKGQAQADAEKS